MTDKTSKADELIKPGPDAPIALSDADMDKVSGGKVRTTDKQQADALKFVKG